MKKKLIVLFLASASLGAFAQTAKPYVSQVWNPDNGNGTYTNPVINADYSDPDVVAVGDDYYLTASSFNCIPGLPILHSKDLVNWELIGHAVTNSSLRASSISHRMAMVCGLPASVIIMASSISIGVTPIMVCSW